MELVHQYGIFWEHQISFINCWHKVRNLPIPQITMQDKFICPITAHQYNIAVCGGGEVTIFVFSVLLIDLSMFKTVWPHHSLTYKPVILPALLITCTGAPIYYLSKTVTSYSHPSQTDSSCTEIKVHSSPVQNRGMADHHLSFFTGT